MAEFPNLGEHCSVPECHQLDILPIKCDACSLPFCRDHMTYDSHSCKNGLKKNVTVPLCPLCNKPVPVGKNEHIDAKIGQHIDRECQSDPADKLRRHTLRCSLATCRKTELVRMPCSVCAIHFCLSHRHEHDHGCPGRRGLHNPLLRKSPNNDHSNAEHMKNSFLDDDEALARALQASFDGFGGRPLTKEELDFQLAKQLQDDEFNSRGRQKNIRSEGSGTTAAGSNCTIS